MWNPKTWVRIAFLGTIEIFGWLLVLLGFAMMVLPGPGILCVFAGVVVLSNRYTWAGRLRRRTQGFVENSTRASVSTNYRIFFSSASAIMMVAGGVFLAFDPTLPFSFSLMGVSLAPQIPGAGLVMGLTIVGGGVIAQALVVYGVLRYPKAITPTAFSEDNDSGNIRLALVENSDNKHRAA